MKKTVRKWLSMVMVSSLFGGVTIGGTNVSAARRVRLANIGKSCYFNSAIQSIYSSNYLREKVFDIYKKNFPREGLPEDLPEEFDFYFKFVEVFNKMNETEENGLLDESFLSSKIDKFVNHNRGGDSYIDVILKFLNSINLFDECLCGTYGLDNSFAFYKSQLDSLIRSANLDCFFLYNRVSIKNWDVPLVYDLGDGVSYKAQSIIVAIGGHAVCFVKQDDGCWRCFDDTNISERTYTFEEVVRTGTIETIFYEMK